MILLDINKVKRLLKTDKKSIFKKNKEVSLTNAILLEPEIEL